MSISYFMWRILLQVKSQVITTDDIVTQWHRIAPGRYVQDKDNGHYIEIWCRRIHIRRDIRELQGFPNAGGKRFDEITALLYA
ncbi:hypothetical protein J6590_080233 [Homalodisca vitripennis]|nr:hypothetical protein J6590_080233 [Homalodisca vitripennis]